MKRRYTVLALVAGVHTTVGLIVLAQSQNASPATAGANKGGTATPQGTGAGPFVTQFQSKSLEPDIQHGAVIAAQGTAAGAPACAQCHAYNGVSDASGAFPRIAGQSRSRASFAATVRIAAARSEHCRSAGGSGAGGGGCVGAGACARRTFRHQAGRRRSRRCRGAGLRRPDTARRRPQSPSGAESARGRRDHDAVHHDQRVSARHGRKCGRSLLRRA